MSRTIICEDSFKWLLNKKFECIFTSMPDLDELGKSYTKAKYITHFQDMTRLVLNAIDDDGAIFYQTDRRMNGLIDKSFLITDVAMKLGYNMLWHRICLRRDVGKVDIYRPTYSHLLCYSKGTKAGTAFADVLECGDKLYSNGIGINAANIVMNWIREKGIELVVDPFCGRGTIPIIANQYGIDSIGVDIDPLQCKYAQTQKTV
jgi:hypothetical protein